MSISPTMKGEYQVLKILRDSIIKGLEEFGIKDGVDCRRFAQANFNHGDKLVLLNLVDSQRVGWQAFNFKFNQARGKEERIDEWIEQQTWQISAIKRMLQNDDTETVSADDMITALITWFNGIGNLDLRKSGIANLPIDARSVMVYNDDSDLYQRRVLFTMEVQVPKSFISVTPDMSTLDIETRPV